MFATGGRGGEVIEVTSLEDNGPGTLREAIGRRGARTIVFRVGGVIRLRSHLAIDQPDVTIAGQTAPGDGICLADATLEINTRNVVLRHLRVRLTENRTGERLFWDCIGGNPERDVIVDHCSVSWGTDESLSLYRHMRPRAGVPGEATKEPVRKLTIQWCLISESLAPATHGATWGGEDATFHHNLFACNGGRNPSIGMSGPFDYRNNVVFNWKHRTVDGGDETSRVNLISNYFKPGPATEADMQATLARIESRNLFSPGGRRAPGRWYPGTPPRPGKWYVAGNVVEGHPGVSADNWKGMRGPVDLARVHTPFAGWPIRQQSAQDAYRDVLAGAGAVRPRRDAIDERVVRMVRSGVVGGGDRGIIRHPDEVGGLPAYGFSPDELAADSDHDGMPDEWERKHRLDPDDGADHPRDIDADGYTNLEEYLNGTDPRRFVDYRDLDNNRGPVH